MEEQIMNGYLRLAGLIVKGVVLKYMSALKYDNRNSIRYCEEWFLSEYGQALSLHNGEFIIEKTRKLVEYGF